jgi:hypothetical protein
LLVATLRNQSEERQLSFSPQPPTASDACFDSAPYLFLWHLLLLSSRCQHDASTDIPSSHGRTATTLVTQPRTSPATSILAAPAPPPSSPPPVVPLHRLIPYIPNYRRPHSCTCTCIVRLHVGSMASPRPPKHRIPCHRTLLHRAWIMRQLRFPTRFCMEPPHRTSDSSSSKSSCAHLPQIRMDDGATHRGTPSPQCFVSLWPWPQRM